MPLEILGPLVVIGIAGVAVLLHVLGYSRRVDLSDAALARAAWLREFPETQVLNIAPADNGRAALVISTIGPGVVWAFGADTVARRLPPDGPDFGAGDMTLTFPDFGTGRMHLPLSPETITQWRSTLREGAE